MSPIEREQVRKRLYQYTNTNNEQTFCCINTRTTLYLPDPNLPECIYVIIVRIGSGNETEQHIHNKRTDKNQNQKKRWKKNIVTHTHTWACVFVWEKYISAA